MADILEIRSPAAGAGENHDEEMARKFEGAAEGDTGVAEGSPGEAEGSTPDRPEWLPEKFKSPEDMAKAYGELEKRLSAPKDEAPKGDEVTPDGDAAEVLESKGLDISEFNSEWEQNGSLSEESYAKLEAAGITKDIVDSYIQGQQVLAEKLVGVVHEAAGGEEEYALLTQWAAKHYSEDEVAAYDQMLYSANPKIMAAVVKGLKAEYEAIHGRQPHLVGGENTGGTKVGFESWAQVTAAMKDSKYGKDPAYTKEVEHRLSLSKF